MPPANPRKCQVPGCSSGPDGAAYWTMDGLSTQEHVLKDLELHVSMAHTLARKNIQNEVKEVRPDKFPRPEICDPATDTDWEYFLSSWKS